MDASYQIGLLSMFSHVTVISSGNRNGFYPTALCEDLNEFDWFVPEKLVFVTCRFCAGYTEGRSQFCFLAEGGFFAVEDC